MKKYSFELASFSVMTVLLLICSCRKDPAGTGCGENSHKGSIVIGFLFSSIPLNSVDSAKVIFYRANATPIEKRFTKKDTVLTVSTSDLPSGDWKAECRVFAHAIGSGPGNRIYLDTIDVDNATNTSFRLNAPTGKVEDIWEGYLSLTSEREEVIFTIPLDHRNPGFEIRVKDENKWDYFFLGREAYERYSYGSLLIDAVDWECSTQCYSSSNIISNNTAFAEFSNRMLSKQWNKGEIFGHLVPKDPTADMVIFFYVYDK